MRPALWFTFPLLLISGTFALPDPGQSNGGASSPAPKAEVVGPTFRFGDFDADGLDDVYVIDPLFTDRLFQNLGTGAFADVTTEHGLEGITGTRMALWFDFDGDRALDLYVSHAAGRSRLLQNTNEGMFVDVTSVSGLAHDGAELFAEVVDYDADQVPDLHLVTEQGDLLFRNLGHGQFERAILPSLGRDATVVDGVQLSIDASRDALGAPAGDAGGSDVQRGAPGSESPADRPSLPSLGGSRSESFSSGSGSASSGAPPQPPPGTNPPVPPTCFPSIDDQATANCLQASSAPSLGMLYPLSTNLFVSTVGRVGLGTTSPAFKLHLVSTDQTPATIEGSALDGTWVGFRNTATGGDTWHMISTGPNNGEGAGKLLLRDNDTSTVAMTLQPNGNVGIGTVAPGNKLKVVDNSSGTVAAFETNLSSLFVDYTCAAAGGRRWSLFSDNGGNFGVHDATAGTTRMTFLPSGRAGIGTSTPEGQLHVSFGSAGTVTANTSSSLVLERNVENYLTVLSPDTSERGILFGEPSSNAAGGIMYNNSSTLDGLQLRTNGNVTRMVVTSNGSVGIGTTGPGSRLEVYDADPMVRVRNSNDTGGTFVGQTFQTMQLGLYNPTGAAWGAVPANGNRAFFGVNWNGQVGSLNNSFGFPTWRNILDDGTGKCGIGRVPTTYALEVQGDACKTSGGSTWLVCSDRRIKTEIATIENALDTIDDLRLVEYRYTPEYLAQNPGTEDKVYYNVIAQEYEEVFPDYVKARADDGILQVDTHPALMHAIAAVQELHTIVLAKDRQIATLEERLARLEEAVTVLSDAK